MKAYVTGLPNEKREQLCAQCFIDLYNKIHVNNYSLLRTEKVFGFLVHKLRWDFVAKQSKPDYNWLAIEVKRLIRPNLAKQFDKWKSIEKKVNKCMAANKIEGSYIVIPGMRPILSQLDNSSLRQMADALTRAISRIDGTIKERDTMDIGDEILKHYPDWPHIPSLAKLPQYTIVKKADPILLYKESNTGSQIEIESASDGFTSYDAENEAVNLLLDKNKGSIAKANAQLGKGKQMGATTTILLFDRCLDSRMHLDIIRETLSSAQSQLCNIDMAHVVDIRQNTVIDVWPQ